MDTQRRYLKPQLKQNPKITQLRKGSVLNNLKNGFVGIVSKKNTNSSACKNHDIAHCWQGWTVKRKINESLFFLTLNKFLSGQTCLENPANRLIQRESLETLRSKAGTYLITWVPKLQQGKTPTVCFHYKSLSLLHFFKQLSFIF